MARDDVMIGGITLAAILLLVGTGTSWLSSFLGFTSLVASSHLAVTATLLLNIALILFGWRRFRELQAEVRRRWIAEQQAQFLAHRDALTGYYNRRALTGEGADKMAAWHAEGKTVAMLLIDVDGFKTINDLFGHAAGDSVIAATANRIAAILPEESMLARLGGDEFAALLAYPTVEATIAVEEMAAKLVHTLAQPIDIDGFETATSASVGCALNNSGGALELLLRHADTAMYRAKRMGRAQYRLFDGDLERSLRHSDLIERTLRDALAAGELYPVYEPLIDLKSGEPIGYEMLARWASPTLGVVPPSDFIPVAEHGGMIGTLTDLLFRQAFREASQWPAHLALSVNVSPLQLRDPWFAQKLLKLIAETSFPAARLIVEVTESAIVDNIAMATTTFASLRNQGVRMVLDDFGTGYSSVASLRSLPFDCVKLDREFVERMNAEGGTDGIAEAVLHLGQSLNLPVVAEGIETLAAAQRLADLDCAIGQGHYYGQALSSDDVVLAHRGGRTGTRKAS